MSNMRIVILRYTCNIDQYDVPDVFLYVGAYIWIDLGKVYDRLRGVHMKLQMHAYPVHRI